MDLLITHFTSQTFQDAFKDYFAELQIEMEEEEWDDLFDSMARENNLAFVRYNAQNQLIGFILFKEEVLKNWFFNESIGFVREFWIAPAFRHQKHGSDLLKLTEESFKAKGIYKILLTTDTAPQFFIKMGYQHDPSYQALNNDDVFLKMI